MDKLYTDERNAQMLLYLMKQYGIKRVIASPGATNVNVVSSMQQDPFLRCILVWMKEVLLIWR